MKERLRIPTEHEGWAWSYVWRSRRRLHPRHHHDELELNLVVRGSASYLVGERRFNLAPRALIWLLPAHEHILLEQSEDFEMRLAVFRRRLVRRLCRSPQRRALLAPDAPGELVRILPRGATATLAEALDHAQELEGQPDAMNVVLGYVLLQAWRAFSRASRGISGDGVHPAVERAAALLRADAAPHGLSELAREVGLSPARLSRLFRAQTGVPLARYRNEARVDRFLELYGGGQRLTMLAAALDAGFGSYAQFHRAFTRLMGTSPRAWLRRQERL